MEICVYCKQPIYFNTTIKDEWVHSYGGTYCQKRGFTATPLRQATPTFYGPEDVL